MAEAAPDRPEVVDAHVTQAALEGVCVLLRHGGRRLFGRFGVTDAMGEITFLPDVSRLGDLPALAIGDRVRIEYWLTGSFFSFESGVHSLAGAGRVRLSRPDRIERKDRRLVSRIRLGGGIQTRCVVEVEGDVHDLDVLDLSTAGLAVRFDRDELELTEGQSIDAWLHLEDCQPFPTRLQVRHTFRRPDGWWVAGTSIASIDEADRKELTRTVEQVRKVA